MTYESIVYKDNFDKESYAITDNTTLIRYKRNVLFFKIKVIGYISTLKAEKVENNKK